jgi:hypothetical protein
MDRHRERLIGYCSRLVTGLVACAVVASTLHADIAAVTVLTAVMLVLLAITTVMLRNGEL